MRDRHRRFWLRGAVSFVSAMTLSAVLGLALARVSGASPRAFQVLSPDDQLTVGSSTVTVDELARRHRPRIVELPQDRPDPVLDVSYEAWREGTDVVLTYFVAWSDERHPHALPHAVYALYRWAYYSGVRDIEYVQVRVAATGELLEVRFETAADLDPWSSRPVHVDAVASVGPDGLTRRLANEGGDRPSEVTAPLPSDGRITLYVATWNHLLDVVPPPVDGADRIDEPIPVPRTTSDYEAVAGARRGHPSPDSAETTGRAVAGRVGGLLFVASPLVGLTAALTSLRRSRR